jgi:Tfp pilus assembly protein PilP
VKSAIAFVMLAASCATLSSCGGGAPPVAVPPVAKPQTAASPAPGSPVKPAQTSPTQLVPSAPAIPGPEPAKYADKGRKDPFTEAQLSSTLGGLAVSTTKLTGIVRGARSVLALLETQEGIGYILKPGDTLGDGRLMEIGADNVVFAVAAKPGVAAQRVVLRLVTN